jgi:hypothetical protein
MGGGTIFRVCESMKVMFWRSYCTLKHGLAMAQHKSSAFPELRLPPPSPHLTRLNRYMFVYWGVWEVLRHGLGA